MHNSILPAVLAGSWYPATQTSLTAMLDTALSKVPPWDDTPPNVMVLPHAGYSYSLTTAAHALVRLQQAQFSRVIILAPSHRHYLPNQLVAPAADAAATPCGNLTFDRDTIEHLSAILPLSSNDQIHLAEHAAQIHYPLLRHLLGEPLLLPLIVGSLDSTTRHEVATRLAAVMDDTTLLLVSSDFTHYGADFGYEPYSHDARSRVEALDRSACQLLSQLATNAFLDHLDRSGATICGRHPLALLSTMLPHDSRLELLHYATSSDQDGDFSRFVCYAVLAGHANWKAATHSESATDMQLSHAGRNLLLQFARHAIETTLRTGRPCHPAAYAAQATPETSVPGGAFVTLKERNSGALRGCIGEVIAKRPRYQAVTAMAVAAAFEDPRFPPLQEHELAQLEIEISLLTPGRPATSWHEIVAGQHGIILHKGHHCALFLPQVATEQGWSVPETLSHLALKAGLPADGWRNGATFTLFEAVVFS